jgi:ABC-type spermidine/putrescine transport system permease subunit I
VTRREIPSTSPTGGQGRDIPASPTVWQRFVGEDGLQKWIFYIPAAFMILFFAIPMMSTVVWSVFERTQFWMEPGFTFLAYENFFTSARVDNYLNSMIHSAWAVVISFVLGFPIAVFVRRRVPKVAQHRVILLFILPFMISELVRVFAMRPVLGRYGLVNSFLMNIGLIDEPITVILFSPLGVIIGDVLSFLPFMVFAGFLAMEAVQKYVFEVCDDLGAGGVRTFRDVIVPLAAPGIFAGSVFIFVNGLGVALVPIILGGPGAVNAGLIVNQAIVALDFPLAMAISTIMIATLVALLYIDSNGHIC